MPDQSVRIGKLLRAFFLVSARTNTFRDFACGRESGVGLGQLAESGFLKCGMEPKLVTVESRCFAPRD